MDDRQITLFVIVIVGLVGPLSLVLAFWLISRMRRKAERPLSDSASGGIAVPVRGLERRFCFFGYSKNSISPRLEIADGGLRFKVFKPDHWLFADIATIDAPWSPFATRLVVRHRTEGVLYVNLADKVHAREFLGALPPGMTLTTRAVAVRDGAA